MARLAVVTGASTGIGFELAGIAAEQGYDLVVAANEDLIYAAARDFSLHGTNVIPVQANLATREGVDELIDKVGGRPIDILCANAGTGCGGAFMDQSMESWRHTIDTNIFGTLYLIQTVLRDMVAERRGRILVTGSIVGYIPGSFNAVYNATKAFIDNFTDALRNELGEQDLPTITTLMPGATDTEFFARAGMLDTRVGANEHKADPADVARAGWDAMSKGSSRIVPGIQNKIQVAVSGIVPPAILAAAHRKIAEPGGAE
jgi:short-subunit dehydrogenase